MMRIGMVLAAVVVALGAAMLGLGAQEADSVRREIGRWMRELPSLYPEGDESLARGSILFRLSGEGGGDWHVLVGKGAVSTGRGAVDSPTTTVECEAKDFAAFLRGTLDPMTAYFTGKVRVSGNLDYLSAFMSKVPLHPAGAAGGGDGRKTDTSGWYQFAPLRLDHGCPSAADASDLLDPPAGKHGFLTVKGDQFVFADGTPARFWGINIVAGNVFMDRETAERTAARLARMGCNMVRFHHMDADWARPNIFDESYDDTRHLSAERLDRLDYLIAQLKRRGIYIYLDLLVHRKFKAGDGVRDWERVENGAKIVAHYNRRIIELQKEYARALFTHKNPYTGLRYRDDPAIALSEFINESSLFWAGGYGTVPPSYLAELDERSRQWAARRHLTVAQPSVLEGLNARNPQVLQFLYETQVAYFTEMRDYLRSLGVRIPLAGSNHWEAMALDLKSNMALDYLDRHCYWDHPQGGWGPEARFDNTPMVKSRHWNPVVWLATQQALNKPLIISEWNCCWINEYIAEGPLTMAAYGAYQGWDGLLQFDYAGGDWADRMDGNFDVGCKPHVLGTYPAAARLFLRGDVRPGALMERRMAEDEVARGALVSDGVPDRAALRRRLAFGFAARGEAAVKPPLPEIGAVAESDDGRLRWDAEAGLITVGAAGSAARVGFAAGPVAAGPVTFELRPEFAVAAVTALDDRPIAESSHLLITATARAENTGMTYSPDRRTATDAGGPPILMEPVRGRVGIALQRPARAARAYVLDPAGARAQEVAVSLAQNALSIELTADAFWYELEITR